MAGAAAGQGCRDQRRAALSLLLLSLAVGCSLCMASMNLQMEQSPRKGGLHGSSNFRGRQMLVEDYLDTYDAADVLYEYPEEDYENDITSTVDRDTLPPPPPEEISFAPPREAIPEPIQEQVPEPVESSAVIVTDDVPAKQQFQGKIQPAGDEPTLLEMSAQSGNIKQLLKALKTEDVNTKFESQGFRTALHIASEHNQIKVVKMLLDKGADPNPKDEFLNTPLHLAIKGNAYLKLIVLLLDARADVNMKNAFEQTALHTALEFMPSLGLLEQLVSVGAKLDKQDSDGNTPLHIGAKNGELLAVEYLLGKGADPTIRDMRGFPVIQVVCRASCHEGNAQQITNAIQQAAKE